MFVASKYCLRLNGTKIVKQINVGKIIEWGKYQLIFVTAEEVSSRPFLFWLKKKKERKKLPTVSLIGSTCVCFCRMTVLPVFDLTHFDWSFPEMH